MKKCREMTTRDARWGGDDDDVPAHIRTRSKTKRNWPKSNRKIHERRGEPEWTELNKLFNEGHRTAAAPPHRAPTGHNTESYVIGDKSILKRRASSDSVASTARRGEQESKAASPLCQTVTSHYTPTTLHLFDTSSAPSSTTFYPFIKL